MNRYSLHNAVQRCEIDDVKSILSQGVDLNELDDLGNSPLHWAVLGGYDDIVLVLLEAGANPNVMASDGITPKWSAVDFGLTQIEEILTAYGGKVATDHNFDKRSWSVFKNAIGQQLPKTEE